MIMREFRCYKCNRLLAKIEGEGAVEVKCPRCKQVSRYAPEIFITIEERSEACTDPETAEN